MEDERKERVKRVKISRTQKKRKFGQKIKHECSCACLE